MLFGVVGLLVALGVVALLAMKQLRATGQAVQDTVPAMAQGAPASAAPPAPTVREQARQVQQQVRDGVGAALQQGADARGDEAAK